MTGFATLITSVADRHAGKRIARALVDNKLAACVQMMPIESVYRWQGDVEEAQEFLLFCKIRQIDFAEAEAAIRASHDYDVPEIVALPITAGSASYLDWLGASTAR